MVHAAKKVEQRQVSLAVKLADCEAERQQVWKLRYGAFIEEAGLADEAMDQRQMLDQDRFDDWCDHLIVKEEESGRVVGTYRLLPGKKAEANGGFYSETMFDLSHSLLPRTRVLELGRSCVDPDYRNGRVIQLLWEGIADYVNAHGYDYLVGCASLRETNIERLSRIHAPLQRFSFLTDRYLVYPHPVSRLAGLRPIQTEESLKELYRLLPPLMKGYLWLGAQFAEEPAYDPILRSIDYFVVLEQKQITEKYRRRFMER
ncbi:GNAT family N-acetyltransferase [Brevibacillus choshinensis]|uniref:GNAT family N-acetyltransferase n=1 Tax=Brevibacillus choshinensis TaxID=54911 RepID=A0ABX7FRC2_BRECH|nr:GNAT family N-acetyltransferase [Brevibacillus choshinensis]QRG68717.1 GNAT family N-acetyltransferase [Brevibacillus choshinensis]